MLQWLRTSKAGFTLVELAIVLSVVGLLSAGLWRLMSSGNQQLRDQNAAALQSQLISSVKAYLATGQAQIYLQGHNVGVPFNLPLPTVNGSGVCTINANFSNFCQYLPPGFTSTTTNSYSQTFTIDVLGDGTGAGAAPSTYSFMILTSGGNVIPDSSGGRITASIGSDGGFVFSTLVCGTAPSTQWACGAYGSWSILLGSYGFGNPATGGYIASRTYVSPEQDSNQPWLARQHLNNDPNYTYNTMVTDLFMGQTSALSATNIWMAGKGLTSGGGLINMQGGSIYMENSTTSTGGGGLSMAGGTLDLQAGTLFLDAGKIQGSATIDSNGVVFNSSLAATGGAGATNYPNAALTLNSGCTISGFQPASPYAPLGCNYVLTVSAMNATDLINANALYAQTFIYQGSDIRLKTNIHKLDDPLEKVMQLKPVSYNLKATGQPSLGVIAQDLEQIYPQLVTQNKGMKSVNYQGLIAPLIGAVQQLQLENDQLRAQMHQQEIKQEKLEQALRHQAVP